MGMPDTTLVAFIPQGRWLAAAYALEILARARSRLIDGQAMERISCLFLYSLHSKELLDYFQNDFADNLGFSALRLGKTRHRGRKACAHFDFYHHIWPN